MATRTIQTTDDAEAGLAYLSKQVGKTSDDFFMEQLGALFQSNLDKADELRFAEVKKLLDDKNKGKSISDLRALLGL